MHIFTIKMYQYNFGHASSRWEGQNIQVILRFLPYHFRGINKSSYISSIMPKVNCNVFGCSNSTYKINKSKKETCTEHNLEAEGDCKNKGGCLEYKPPFYLHTFPGHIKCKQLREAQINAVRQEPFDKKKDLRNHLQVIESVLFILFIDW